MSKLLDWCWRKDDAATIFASARQALVPADDAAFLTFAETQHVSRWPVDDAGAQTDAALQWVFDNVGLQVFVTPALQQAALQAELARYANAKRWALAIGGYTITLSGQVRTFATDDISRGLVTGKFVRLTQPNPPATMSWQFATGFEDVTAADFAKAAMAAGDFVQASFDALRPVLAAIAAGTITTVAEVDAAGWPSAVAAS